MSTTSARGTASNVHHYVDFLQAIQKTFKASGKEPLFLTDVPEVWSLFLDNIAPEARQSYNCSTCRHFVNRFGRLVRIDQDGNSHSVLWNAKAVPAFFQPAVNAMQQAVEQATIVNVFVSSAVVYGQPQTGPWQHMAVTPEVRWSSCLSNAGQQIAKKHEAFQMLSRALEAFSAASIDTAVKLLRSDKLYRAEKVLGMAEWFREVHKLLNQTIQPKQRTNKQWLAVATAPEGFCHIRSSIIGTLLADIESGMEYEAIRRNFAAKMHPLQYQRPQTPPSEGNIKQAEKIIAALQAEQALSRRFACIDELLLVWKPQITGKTPKANDAVSPTSQGIFSHLLPEAKASSRSRDMRLPIETLTWEKFERKVLADALTIEYLVPKTRQNYTAITTAVNPNAPPILQWDRVEQRNPFSVYVYHDYSLAEDWYLTAGYVEVTGMCTNPPHWYNAMSHHSKGMILLLQGAKDSRYQTAGACIFPENLKSDFSPVRKTIEAFSRTAKLEGFDEASACGLFINSTGELKHQLRVTTRLGVQEYCIDRWD